MAITSVGYPNSVDPSINAEAWALMQGALGESYWVEDADAASVSVVGSAARTVRVSPGRIGGGGVMDTIDDDLGPNDIVLPDPGSGTVYYTIVARRVWQTTNATTLTYVTGNTSRSIAAGRETDPGTIDDHPLALVAVAAGNPTPSVSADLRAVGNAKGRYEATDQLVLGYMNKPGYVVRIGGTEWLRTLAGTWEKRASFGTATNFWTQESGWRGDKLGSVIVRDGKWRSMVVEQRAEDSTNVTSTNTGNVTIPAFRLTDSRDFPFRAEHVTVRYRYNEDGPQLAFGHGVLYTDGTFVIENLAPGLDFRGHGVVEPYYAYDIRVTLSYYSGTNHA